MASNFKNTLTGLKNVLTGAVGKRVPQTIQTKLATGEVNTKHELHLSSKQCYPAAEPLPLPLNIDPTESTRFSPQRARDISSTTIATNIYNTRIDMTVDQSAYPADQSSTDIHVGSYDCTGAVSLNSSMQSNVPSPFGSMAKFTQSNMPAGDHSSKWSTYDSHSSHLNMPGGQWEQGSKWASHDLHSSHYTNLRREVRKNWSNGSKSSDNADKGIYDVNLHASSASSSSASLPLTELIRKRFMNANAFACSNHLFAMPNGPANFPANLNVCRFYSTKSSSPPKNEEQVTENPQDSEKPVTELTRAEKLKRAVKEYGSTVIVFHIGMSLASLGIFYQLVASGLDMVAILEYLGLANATISNNIATGASTFVIAYAVHKVFAPVRITITLTSTPLIVRYLRKRGILKAPVAGGKSTSSPSSSAPPSS